MRLKYQCPVCWEDVLAPPSLQGKPSPCPECGTEIDAWPAPLNARPSHPAPAARPERRGWWGRQRRAVRAAAVASAVVLLLGCPLSAYFALRDRGSGRPVISDAEYGNSWSNGPVTVEAIEAAVRDPESLLVFVTVRTADDRKRLNFTGWRRAGVGSVKLRDDAGNSYAQRAFDPATDAAAEAAWNARPEARGLQFGPGAVTPEQGRVEILVFPKPPPGAHYVDLDLAGRTLGLNGVIRLRLQSEMWRKPDANPAPKAKE